MSTSIAAISDCKYSYPTYNPNYDVPKILFSNHKPLMGPYKALWKPHRISALGHRVYRAQG